MRYSGRGARLPEALPATPEAPRRPRATRRPSSKDPHVCLRSRVHSTEEYLGYGTERLVFPSFCTPCHTIGTRTAPRRLLLSQSHMRLAVGRRRRLFDGLPRRGDPDASRRTGERVGVQNPGPLEERQTRRTAGYPSACCSTCFYYIILLFELLNNYEPPATARRCSTRSLRAHYGSHGITPRPLLDYIKMLRACYVFAADLHSVCINEIFA